MKMKKVTTIIFMLSAIFMGGHAVASGERLIESCTSAENLDWYVKVTDIGGGKYKLENYKLVAKSSWTGNENYKVVFSSSAVLPRQEFLDNTIYGSEEPYSDRMQMRIETRVSSGGKSLKADLYVFNSNTGEYDRHPYFCDRK